MSHKAPRRGFMRANCTFAGCAQPGCSVQRPPCQTRIGAHGDRVAAGRLSFAHADWSGYSIFEEAFTRGHIAGASLA